jgi:hypothetical protein
MVAVMEETRESVLKGGDTEAVSGESEGTAAPKSKGHTSPGEEWTWETVVDITPNGVAALEVIR